MYKLILYLGVALTVIAVAIGILDIRIQIERPTAVGGLEQLSSAPFEEQEVVASSDSSLKSPTEISGNPESIGAEDYFQRNRENCVVNYYADESGVPEPSLECAVPEPGPPHPYASYPDKALADLAYGDPKAAEILGQRWISRATEGTGAEQEATLKARGIEYHLRAAALSGDVSLINKGAGAAYSRFISKDGLVVENIVNSFVLGEVASRLGGESVNNSWQQEFEALGFSDAQVLQIESRISEIMKRTAHTQTAVTGNTEFAEALDDA